MAVVDDLKTWMLFEEKEKRFLSFTDSTGQPQYRGYNREEVLKRYLETVISSIPKEKQEGPFWLLMPSISDDARRVRYRETLEKAVPGASVLPEPEMIVEYFRLVRRDLTLEKGRTGIFLVVDAGAATCNFTFVFTRKDEKVVDSAEGRQRAGRLRAVRGDAAPFSGRWVDKAIMRLLKSDAAQLDRSLEDELLAAVERTKVQVSETGSEAVIRHTILPSDLVLSVTHLEHLSKDLWQQLAVVYEQVATRFLAQLRNTQYAQEQFGPLLHERNVRGVRDVQHLVDAVLLAGGTSLLPGFEQAMKEAIFPNAQNLRVLRVGSEYPVAAAVGALAHILHQQYQPSRLRASADAPESLAANTFQGTLPTDLFLGWKYKGNEEKESRVLVLGRDEPFAEESRTRAIAELPDFKRGVVLSARLLPGTNLEKIHRRGLKPTELRVNKAPGRLHLAWNATDREARLVSGDVNGASNIFLSLDRFANNDPPPDDFAGLEIPPDMLLSAGASDVVIDVGMSKTVAVSAQRGTFSVKTLLLPSPPDLSVPPPLSHVSTEEPASAGARTTQPRIPMPESGEEAAAIEPQPSQESLTTEERELVAGTNVAIDAATRNDDLAVGFGARLERALDETKVAGVKEVRAELTMLLLALSVRPFVILSGPPGSGKSTLVRIAAKLLDATSDERYFEISVQPHWREGTALPKVAQPPFHGVAEASQPIRLFLFDEFNLARPEHYLMPFFRELDTSTRQPSQGRVLACGTLNIDDASRPPSPKIMDRCFLIEIDAPAVDPQPSLSILPSEIDVLPVVPLPITTEPTGTQLPMLWEPVNAVLGVIRKSVREHNLRQDLLPSRRVLGDIAALLRLYDHAAIPKGLLPEVEVVDRALAGRMLVKLSGAAEQVEPLVDALERHFKDSPYERCRRRISLARAQLQLGFVSPWQ